MILVPLLYAYLWDPKGLSGLGLRREASTRSNELGILALGPVIVVWLAVYLLYGGWETSWRPASLLRDVIWFPIYEEVTYRGFFLSQVGLKILRRPLTANLLQTAFFAGVHWHFVAQGMALRMAGVVVLGLATGLVFLKTRNLLGCITCHALANLLASVLAYVLA